MAERHAAGLEIFPWDMLPERDALLPEIDGIFFEASATKTFSSEEERNAFRERWLGRYLKHFPRQTYVALTPERSVRGYVIGSIEDPAHLELFRDISYFRAFSSLTRAFPAQLHVNVARAWRNLGLGASLVETFCGAAREAGVPGVHVVTVRGARNVGFYERLGFAEKDHISCNGRDLVFLARLLRD